MAKKKAEAVPAEDPVVITTEVLRGRLSYNAETGKFAWRLSGKGIRKDLSAGSKHGEGYLTIRILGRLYLCHRLAWLYVFGEWPINQIDHINGIRTDNRIANLRECSNRENCQNVKPHKDGAGLLGASWEKRKAKWQSGIGSGGKRIFLGYFDTKEAAHCAYLTAKKELHTFGAENV